MSAIDSVDDSIPRQLWSSSASRPHPARPKSSVPKRAPQPVGERPKDRDIPANAAAAAPRLPSRRSPRSSACRRSAAVRASRLSYRRRCYSERAGIPRSIPLAEPIPGFPAARHVVNSITLTAQSRLEGTTRRRLGPRNRAVRNPFS